MVVDVAIDQGICFQTSRPAAHSDPTITADEIGHYCVADALDLDHSPPGLSFA